MAAKTSLRAASKRKNSAARKSKKSSAKKPAGRQSRSTRSRKSVSVEKFVKSIRTLHDLGLVAAFMKSAKRAKLSLTMDAAPFERVRTSVNKLRPPASGSTDPFDFASNNSPGGLAGVKPLPGQDPFDF